MNLYVNYNGPVFSYQPWRFHVNDSTGAWIFVGDNSKASDWVWSYTNYPMVSTSDYKKFFSNQKLFIQYSR